MPLIRTSHIRTALPAIVAVPAFGIAFLAASFGYQIWASKARLSRIPSAASGQGDSSHTLYCGLWRTDGLFVSTIRIKNVLVIAPLEVQPILYMADGTAYNLPPITVPNGGVSTININQALAQIPSSLAGHASEYGSAALVYHYSSPGHVFGSIQSLDVTHSLTFVYPFFETMKMDHSALQTVEGLWWKHDPDVSGFVSLANITDAAVKASLQFIDSHGEPAPARFVTVSAHSTQMLHLDELAADFHDRKEAGGIRVQFRGRPAALVITGGLVNEDEGYSANIPFWMHDSESSAPLKITYGLAGLMVGKPDPMMMPGFPVSTEFSLYLAARNTTERPLDAKFQLNYMNGASIVTRSLPNLQLRPFEATQVDMRSTLKSVGLAKFSGMVNLSISYTGRTGDLILAGGSVDQTGTYVFEVEPQGVGPSNRKIGSYWSVADGNDTMFGLWNPTDAAQDIAVTFYYGDGSGKYVLPVSLMPQGSTMIDMGMLIAERMPDANGKIIPATVQQGSVSFLSSDETKRMTLVIAGGTFNVETATCGRICTTCCAILTPVIEPSSPQIPAGNTAQGKVVGFDCTGGQSQLGVASWASNKTAVATVNSSGLMSGVSAGTATVSAQLDGTETTSGELCGYPNGGFPTCPFTRPNIGTPVTVQPTVTFNADSPSFVLVGTDPSITVFNLQQVIGSPAGGTYAWTGSAGGLSFSPNDSTSADVTTVTATSGSTSLNDTTLTVNYTVNNEAAKSPATKQITMRKFAYLTGPTLVTVPIGSGNFGYAFNATYIVFTDPGQQQLQSGFDGIVVAESVSGCSGCITGSGATNANSQVVDQLAIISSQPLPSNFKEVVSQTLSIGGFLVRQNTVTYTATGVTVTNNGPTS